MLVPNLSHLISPDGNVIPTPSVPTEFKKPMEVVAGEGLRVIQDKDSAIISRQPDVLPPSSAEASSTQQNTKWFGCNLTGPAQVTVNEGVFYSYDVYDPFGPNANLRQLQWVVSEETLTDLVSGDRIFVSVNRNKILHIASADVAGVGDDTASWLYAEFANADALYGITALPAPTPGDQFPITIGGPFYYQLATYYNDSSGERVVQHNDGFFDVPLIYLPKAIT